jgi:hypothetical protein
MATVLSLIPSGTGTDPILVHAMNYAPRRDLVARSVAYFPEGVFCGPQRMAGESLVLLLQLGGASGQGFMGYEDLQAGHAALAARGVFDGGVYRGPEGDAQEEPNLPGRDRAMGAVRATREMPMTAEEIADETRPARPRGPAHRAWKHTRARPLTARGVC